MHRSIGKSSESKRYQHILKYLRQHFLLKGILLSCLYHVPIDFNGDAKACHENTVLGILPSLGTQYTVQSKIKTPN